MNIDPSSTEWCELKQEGMQTSDYSAYLKLCKRSKKNQDADSIKFRKKIKLAIIGSASTDFIPEPLAFALRCNGIESEILPTPYNTYAYQLLDAESPVSVFQPDVILFVNTPFVQPEWPDINSSDEDINNMLERTADYWLNLCRTAHNSSGSEIIFDNFFQLPYRFNGNLAAKLKTDHNSYLTRLNQLIAQNAPAYVHINDVAWLSSHYGVSNWLDLKYWHHAKLPVSLTHIVPYIKNISRITSTLYGGAKKVLVLDLDNTLWGGVIGDDGLDGIKIGQGNPAGEAFLLFQRYILQLKARGVLLAVCSKNDEVNARLPFEQHPEMLLKLDDFVCFVANWEAKPDNVIDISKQLNLGLDSFVFVDDNPVERELMRFQLPDVLTIELNDDPADYVLTLDQQGPFELTSISDEDTARTNQYKENLERDSLKASVSDYNDYLTSLVQQATVSEFKELRLDRITQLINKTNQFNLTTLRKTRSEVEEIMRSENHMSAYVQLTDKFGDNGIIAVVYGTWSEQSLTIDGWLMSCRVLKRGVEKMICNYIVECARAQEKKYINGRYIQTDKNSMVKNLYSELGFELTESLDDEETTWLLDTDTYIPAEHTIEVEVI